MNPALTETTCCALHIITANNEHSERQIKEVVDFAYHQYKKRWTPERRGGAPTIDCMAIMPYEQPLAKNLEKIGFKKIDVLSRRNGYPEGEIHQYRLHLSKYVAS